MEIQEEIRFRMIVKVVRSIFIRVLIQALSAFCYVETTLWLNGVFVVSDVFSSDSSIARC